MTLVLQETCTTCKGIGPEKFSCTDCDAIGYVLTVDGHAVARLIHQILDMREGAKGPAEEYKERARQVRNRQHQEDISRLEDEITSERWARERLEQQTHRFGEMKR